MRTIVTIVVLAIIAALTILIWWIVGAVIGIVISKTGWPPLYIGFWVSLAISIAIGSKLAYNFVYYGIRKIENDPPHKAVLTFLGKRMEIVLDEGWCFLPLCPIVFNAIPVDVRKINQDLLEQNVKTPDLADLGVTMSITWTPGASTSNKKEQAEALINYLNSGGEERVKSILQDIIRDRLRIWAFSKEEGPVDWQEAMAAKDEAIAILVKAILGEDIPSILSSIPTSVLLKYFNEPPKNPLAYEKKRWGKQSKNGSEWEGLEREFQGLSPEEFNNLKQAVKERRDIITKVRQGNGCFIKKSLGITINRFTINDVVLKGDVAKAVEARVKEVHEGMAQQIELENLRRRVQKLQKDLNITAEQALEAAQTENQKVVKTIAEKKLNISPETREAGEKIAEKIISALSGK